MQAILHGNAGFGKTSLIKSLLGLKCSTDERSTGVMEEPKRIELSTVSVEGSDCSIKWMHIEDLQEETALLVKHVNSDQISSYLFPGKRNKETEEYEEEMEYYPHQYSGMSEFKKYTVERKR